MHLKKIFIFSLLIFVTLELYAGKFKSDSIGVKRVFDAFENKVRRDRDAHRKAICDHIDQLLPPHFEGGDVDQVVQATIVSALTQELMPAENIKTIIETVAGVAPEVAIEEIGPIGQAKIIAGLIQHAKRDLNLETRIAFIKTTYEHPLPFYKAPSSHGLIIAALAESKRSEDELFSIYGKLHELPLEEMKQHSHEYVQGFIDFICAFFISERPLDHFDTIVAIFENPDYEIFSKPYDAGIILDTFVASERDIDELAGFIGEKINAKK